MPSGSKQPTPGVRRVIRRPPTPASEYEDEDKPTARSRRSEEEPEENRRPNRGSRRPRDDEEPEETTKVSRRSRDKDADDEEDDVYKDSVSTGWGGAKQLKSEMPSDFAQQFTVPEDEPVIIKFLQHEPFANYKQHWCEWLGKGQKLSYVCPNTKTRKICPICANGDKPQAKFGFNIVDFTDPDNPINSILIVGFKLSNVLEKMDKDKRTMPLDREDQYFAVHKTGAEGSRGRRGGTVQTNFNPVKERDLEQDWDVQPLTDDELEEFMSHVYVWEDVAPKTSLKKLEEVAEAMDD
jgi:hypothetical protein